MQTKEREWSGESGGGGSAAACAPAAIHEEAAAGQVSERRSACARLGPLIKWLCLWMTLAQQHGFAMLMSRCLFGLWRSILLAHK